ncbi:conserved hypothetical protein [Anaeromyxobacter dehalogenans 2CP-1]|uniref:Uncharacterized protein n=1 Tax=Anaeromyxobacter dehalogenans (strain ATCC BAA-258 / DSM 21875 / 2CP-1) TaxID=455488 RepID=B8J9W8_ANAD2|nr:hypothetical protein [Anaeromyxobacter dehalogenans]ACL63671.1 conserved hypothetical protein [Anaeromyxobacter dehalogenans 2CP-1]
MASRLRRFLHLERPRDGAPAPDPAPGTADRAARFGAVQRPGVAPAETPATGARLERFGAEPEPALQLLDPGDRLPFTRCLRCGMDGHALAVECAGCGAALDTPEQRAADERLRVERARQAEVEARAAAARREALAREEAGEAGSRRALAEALAREVGERERRRLEAEGLGGGPGPLELGARVLRALGARWGRGGGGRG